jgi:hypothetical protein
VAPASQQASKQARKPASQQARKGWLGLGWALWPGLARRGGLGKADHILSMLSLIRVSKCWPHEHGGCPEALEDAMDATTIAWCVTLLHSLLEAEMAWQHRGDPAFLVSMACVVLLGLQTLFQKHILFDWYPHTRFYDLFSCACGAKWTAPDTVLKPRHKTITRHSQDCFPVLAAPSGRPQTPARSQPASSQPGC